MQKLKAIIFDLDNCLAPAKEVGEQNYLPAFDAIKRANNGALSQAIMDKAFIDIWRHPLDWVATTYGFSQEMLKVAWVEFSKMRVDHVMGGYGDLDILVELPVDRYLVTSGFRGLQESKIKALGIDHLFSEIYIDAIDEPNRLGKKAIFERIMKERKLYPNELLVVGDNEESEIAAGNQLGIATVQTLRPEVPPGNIATHRVEDLAGLRDFVFSRYIS